MCAYKTKKELAEEYQMSIRTVVSRINGIKKEMEAGRYNRYSIIEDAKTKVSEFVFIDYCKYRKYLENPILRKTVPPFSPELIREVMQASV